MIINKPIINEISQLRKQWGSAHNTSIKRSKTLIVPALSYSNNQGDLHNNHWAYVVPYAFRAALDIQLSKLQTTRTLKDENGKSLKDANGKNKTETRYYSAWTQGGILRFSEGDFFTSRTEQPDIQIIKAKPMSWNATNDTMYEGEVTYQSFIKMGLADYTTVSQLDFLQLLITGKQ